MREIRKDTNNIGNVYGGSNKFTIKKKKNHELNIYQNNIINLHQTSQSDKRTREGSKTITDKLWHLPIDICQLF